MPLTTTTTNLLARTSALVQRACLLPTVGLTPSLTSLTRGCAVRVHLSDIVAWIALSVLATPSTLGADNVPDESARTRAVQALRKLGAEIRIGPFHGNVVRVNLEGRGISDNDLKHLRHMPGLEKLYLAQTKTTNAGLRHLRCLSQLRRLSLWDTQVTDAGLKHLAGLTNLEALDIHGLEITDAGLAHLKALTRLNYLNLKGTAITNAGLKHLRGKKLRTLELGEEFTLTPQGLHCLKGMPIDRLDATILRSAVVHLRGLPKFRHLPLVAEGLSSEDLRQLRPLTGVWKLSISEKTLADWATNMRKFPNLLRLEVDGRETGGATDAHIAQLARLKKLTVLKFIAVPVTDRGLAHLAVLKNLRELDVGRPPMTDAQITDAGIDHLLGLSKLKSLNISGSKVTDKGLAKLRKLHHLKVVIAYDTKITDAAAWGGKAVLPGVRVELFD